MAIALRSLRMVGHRRGDRPVVFGRARRQAADHTVAVLGRAVLTELALALDRGDLEREGNDVR
jgi:hypothetical protein